ncbi:DUF6702 family protein [Lacibacter sediminis]|uniref:Uncharacterized protein n=1 Tax=Lacibacter sediminis TaxID=2760713 RepID=A0A7G5XDG7_9BACT|nr:DUF6702 family protein [Lacibacter sediminis]QNA43520.1 hypothetical protein H4075_15740 [Lacibacter sediminis]
MKFNTKMVAELYERLGKSKPVVDSGKLVVEKKSLAGSRLSSVVRRLFFLATLGFWLTAFSAHPYYMSVTEFEYKPAEKEVQVACKIFTDDLEEALKKEYKRKVDIMNISTKKENEQLLNRYLQQHLRLQLDGKAAALQMIGFEQEGEAVWIYLVTSNTTAFKSAVVFNDLLYSYREDQLNIIHFKNKGERKSHRFTFPNKEVALSW